MIPANPRGSNPRGGLEGHAGTSSIGQGFPQGTALPDRPEPEKQGRIHRLEHADDRPPFCAAGREVRLKAITSAGPRVADRPNNVRGTTNANRTPQYFLWAITLRRN